MISCWLYFLFIVLSIIIFSIARQDQTDVARICCRTREKILCLVDSRSNFGWMIISDETRPIRCIRWSMWCLMCKILVNIITFLCCWVLLGLPRIAARNRRWVNPLCNDGWFNNILERFIIKINFICIHNTRLLYVPIELRKKRWWNSNISVQDLWNFVA